MLNVDSRHISTVETVKSRDHGGPVVEVMAACRRGKEATLYDIMSPYNQASYWAG